MVIKQTNRYYSRENEYKNSEVNGVKGVLQEEYDLIYIYNERFYSFYADLDEYVLISDSASFLTDSLTTIGRILITKESFEKFEKISDFQIYSKYPQLKYDYNSPYFPDEDHSWEKPQQHNVVSIRHYDIFDVTQHLEMVEDLKDLIRLKKYNKVMNNNKITIAYTDMGDTNQFPVIISLVDALNEKQHKKTTHYCLKFLNELNTIMKSISGVNKKDRRYLLSLIKKDYDARLKQSDLNDFILTGMQNITKAKINHQLETFCKN